MSAKYANRGTAAAQLELVAASALQHSARGGPDAVRPEFEDALDALSGLSETAYSTLLHTPGFVAYFQEASPVEELARLKIGSRPARRFGAASLSDLRAIPWVFAWSQNRHLITGWYGFGTAVENFRRVRGAAGEQTLHTMFHESSLFRLMVDEVEKSLCLTDLYVAADYASLVTDDAVRERVFDSIASEFARASEATRWLTRRSAARAALSAVDCTVRPCAGRSGAVFTPCRSGCCVTRARRSTGNALSVPLLQSMTCIATALGWTG